jgi:hypothetical protein
MKKAPAALKAPKEMKHLSKVKGAVVVFIPIGLPGMGKSVFYESTFKP